MVLKFDTMEISKIANDILRIQLLTAEESEYQLQLEIDLLYIRFVECFGL